MKNYIFNLYDTVMITSGNFAGETGVIRDVTTKESNTMYGLKLKDVDALLYFKASEIDN